MRYTTPPPWLRAESHEHRQLNTLPRCMRPEGDGAKRPTTGVGSAVAGASAACVAMLRALISMRTSIAREVGEAPARQLDRHPPAQPLKRQKPRQLFATAGVSAEKGDMILKRTAKGQTVFAQLLYAPLLADSISAHAATQSRYTCDGAMKWYLLPERAMPRSVPDCRQIRNVPRCRPRA